MPGQRTPPATPYHLLPCLDGSDFRWRYPHCYFDICGPDGKPATKMPLRCGNLDALQAGDFVREYLLRCVDSTAEPRTRPWLGDLSPEEGAKRSAFLERVPRTTVTSNEIRIKILGRCP